MKKCVKKCKHPSSWGYSWGYRRVVFVDGKLKYMLFCKCDCGAWLPLGPSDESDERVRVEIRAAEIAAGIANPAMNTAVAYAAKCGYDGKQTPFAWGCGWDALERAWHAGYLARCILEHAGGGE